jgi:uncharacterized protein (TIGR02147 family)
MTYNEERFGIAFFGVAISNYFGMMSKKMNSIFQYTDYRIYLTDWYTERKAQGSPVSNRWIAQKMQINSSSWFTNLRSYKVGLSKETALKLSKILKHSSIETDYFITMVFFNQASTMEERDKYYQELVSLRNIQESRCIVSHEYEYFATWYFPVIRALIDQINFKDDFKQLSSMVVPPISELQAKRSVEVLEELGLIAKNAKGYYHVTTSSLTTNATETALAITNFQKETMRLAYEALDRYKRTERDISTLTIGISSKTMEQIKEILAETRRKIVQAAIKDTNEDSVYQVNFQFFPVGKSLKKDKESK